MFGSAGTGGSSGGGSTTGSSGSSSGFGSDESSTNPTSPPGCPGKRIDDVVQGVTEAMIRERAPGIYRVCGGEAAGLEIRIDPATDRLTTYHLDGRFVRDGSEGWLEIGECNLETCQAVSHVDGANRQILINLWTDPVAIEITDSSSFEGSQEWARVSN